MVSKTFNSEDIDLGLVGFWPLNDLRISTSTAIDKSRNSNNGTISGATEATGPDGKRASAMNFDGVNDQIIITDPTEIKSLIEYSCSIWIRSTRSLAQFQDYVTLSALSTDRKIDMYTDTSDLIGCSMSASGVQESLASSVDATDEAWHHVVALVDDAAKEMRLYVDGVLEDTEAYVGTLDSPDSDLKIVSNNTGDYEGDLQNLRIYNRPISQGVITKLFNQKL